MKMEMQPTNMWNTAEREVYKFINDHFRKKKISNQHSKFLPQELEK